MAEVRLNIAGRDYPVNCRDGEEGHLTELGRIVDAKAQDAHRAVGGVNEARNLLLAALLLADELTEARKDGGGSQASAAPAPAPVNQPDFAPVIEKLAARIESLAERLERTASNT